MIQLSIHIGQLVQSESDASPLSSALYLDLIAASATSRLIKQSAHFIYQQRGLYKTCTIHATPAIMTLSSDLKLLDLITAIDKYDLSLFTRLIGY